MATGLPAIPRASVEGLPLGILIANDAVETIDQQSMADLQHYDWPGNARERRSVVERAMMVATGRRLRIALPSPAGAANRDADMLEAMERVILRRLSRRAEGGLPVQTASRPGSG